ncbi:protein kinase domain-containing protein [Streptomyces narbonensis]|uniref:protein kinase domain-containing protein n=1 Tax=Streptomyces narbonensis TaxID=67333 RepID=UPI0016784C11|nr:protein kinase [Streptomyces narbonensis]
MAAGTGETRLTVLGHYQVAELLGAGGMGEVYLAHSPSGRAVAVKVIREDLAAKPGFRERFAREVQAARQVSGAFTAPVLDADTTGPTPWMATQYVEGPTLADVVNDRGTLPADEVWRLASGLCEALRDIHRAGLVHRDLKPGNILLAEDGPRVIDFGISRVVDATALTQSGQILGTPLFMAPEQFRTPRDAGPAADVFALGSVLVYAATGHGPFDADTPYAIAWNAVHEDPDLTGLPESLRPVVEPCLRKDPAERPAPETLLTLLSSRRERRAHRTSAREAALARTRRARLRRGALAAGAVAGAALIVGVWTWWPDGGGDESPRKPLATAGAARPTPTTTPAPVRLPGWKPWTKQVRTTMDPPDRMLNCRYQFSALWCTGNGVLAARLDPLTGEVLWQREGPDRGPAPLFELTRSATFAAVYDDGTGTGTGTNPSHKIWTFDPATGDPLLERVLPGTETCGTAAQTLFCTHDGKISAWDAGSMTRMWTAASGWELFLPPAGSPPGSRVHVVRRDPDQRVVEVGEITQGDGTLLWNRSVSPDTDVVTISEKGYVYAASPARQDMTGLTRTDRRTGAEKSVELGASEELLGIVGDVFYTHRGGVISAYDIAAERLLWSSPTLHEGFSAPAVAGDRVHFTAEDGTVIALNRHDGVALWERRPPKSTIDFSQSDPPPSSQLRAPVIMGDVIIAPAYDSRIHSFLAPDPATPPRSKGPSTTAAR